MRLNILYLQLGVDLKVSDEFSSPFEMNGDKPIEREGDEAFIEQGFVLFLAA